MNEPSRKTRLGKAIATALAMLLTLCVAQGSLGAYFATRTLTLTVSPNLSAVPTPTPVPTATPTPAPTPTPTPVPGNGLVFDNAASMISVTWRSPYSGTLTGISMTADNVKHNLAFYLEFTAPDWFTQDTPSWQQTLLDGLSMKLSAVNRYPYAIGLDEFGSNNSGTGTLQLGSLNMQPGERKTDIVMNMWSSGINLPTYKETGNKVVFQTNQSYTFIGYNVPEQNNSYKRDKYTYSATITIIVPSHVPSPTPTATPSPTPTVTAISSPTPTVTVTPSPTPEATTTSTATAASTETPTPTAAPTATPSPTDAPTQQSVTQSVQETSAADADTASLQSVPAPADSQPSQTDSDTTGDSPPDG